jgi:DNA-directed RNA polymerase specialized sigma24 family protein
MNRLDALAAEFGADTSPEADWGKMLPRLAKEVYHEFTRPGGKNGFKRHGKDVLSAEELVNWVYMRWAGNEKVTVEWFATLDNPGAMLRTFLRNAARDLVWSNVEGQRLDVSISVTTTGMSGAGIEDPGAAVEAMRTPGAMAVKSFDWLVNSIEYASEDGNPEDDYAEAELLQEWEGAIEDILGDIENPAHRTLAERYYLEGDEIEEAAAVVGMGTEASKKALQRSRQALGEARANALIVWRRASFPNSGRQPLSIEGGVPENVLSTLGS